MYKINFIDDIIIFLGLQGIDPEENIKEDKITLPDYEEDSRPSMQEDHENFDEDSKIDSMSMEEAQTRLIDPENIVIGGKTSASMYEFVPSQATKNGLGHANIWLDIQLLFTCLPYFPFHMENICLRYLFTFFGH